MASESRARADNASDREWDAMLLDLGAPAERLPVVKTILTQSGITKENLHELIRFSESPMGMHRPFP